MSDVETGNYQLSLSDNENGYLWKWPDCDEEKQSTKTEKTKKTRKQKGDKDVIKAIVEQTSFHGVSVTCEISIISHSHLFGRAARWQRMQKASKAVSKRVYKNISRD